MQLYSSFQNHLRYTLIMIKISDSKQLGIILPNTNKAFNKVLTQASQEELSTITQSKDLKSIIHTIFKQSAQNPNTNSQLLELVKNNPTLKNLGDVTKTIQELISSLKSDTKSNPLERKLLEFLNDIKDVKASNLEQKIQNSGVFLESRLKNIQNPQIELKNLLTELAKKLQGSNNPVQRTIANEAKQILQLEPMQKLNTLLKNENKTNSSALIEHRTNPASIKELSADVQKLVSKLQTEFKKADPIYSPALSKAVEKLQHRLDPKLLTSESFQLAPLKDSLEQIISTVQRSFLNDSKSILDSLTKIFKVLQSIDQNVVQTQNQTSLEAFVEKKLPQKMTQLLDQIKNVIEKASPHLDKETRQIVSKLETIHSLDNLQVENKIKKILSSDFKSVLLQASDEVSKSNHPNQIEISKNIEKLSLQIDHYQLLSHLSNGTSIYLPFSWDMMEEGNINLRKSEDDTFYVDIDLKLKEYGPLQLKLTLYEKNQLKLNIYTSHEGFRSIIQDNISSLRSALIDSQLTPREIRIHQPQTPKNMNAYSSNDQQIYMGFEIKG